MFNFINIKAFKDLFSTGLSNKCDLICFYDHLHVEIFWEDENVSNLCNSTVFFTKNEIILSNDEINKVTIQNNAITSLKMSENDLFIYFTYRNECNMFIKIKQAPIFLQCNIKRTIKK